MLMSCVRTLMLTITTLCALAVAGCGGSGATRSDAAKSATPAADASCPVAENWCGEHGVPEDICAQCNAKLAAEFKQKGDWCKEHNRPESQCFLCSPQRAEKFAAEYEAKYGQKPPKKAGM